MRSGKVSATEGAKIVAQAGDTLITNPSGTVAIKSSDPTCAAMLEDALSDVP